MEIGPADDSFKGMAVVVQGLLQRNAVAIRNVTKATRMIKKSLCIW